MKADARRAECQCMYVLRGFNPTVIAGPLPVRDSTEAVIQEIRRRPFEIAWLFDEDPGRKRIEARFLLNLSIARLPGCIGVYVPSDTIFHPTSSGELRGRGNDDT